MGVWIETRPRQDNERLERVTPYVGVWIETRKECHVRARVPVTPYVGVWIETTRIWKSLKSLQRHSLCGSVD